MTAFLQIDYLSKTCLFNIHIRSSFIFVSLYFALKLFTGFVIAAQMVRRNFGRGGYTKSLTEVISFLEPRRLTFPSLLRNNCTKRKKRVKYLLFNLLGRLIVFDRTETGSRIVLPGRRY